VRIFPLQAHYICVRRDLCFFLFTITVSIGYGAADPESGAKAITSSDPLILQVQVVEGEGLTYAPQTRAVKGITVRVTDEVGRPVAGAAVSFRLPEEGATGVFQNNSKTEIAATTADGRASVWGMRWGKAAGAVTVRITAAKGATRAGTIATQLISADSAAGPMIANNRRAYQSRGGGSKKWLWYGLAAAGAAGGGFAAYEMMKGGSSASAAVISATGTTISAPTVSVGPH
jgi:hypothetical protein